MIFIVKTRKKKMCRDISLGSSQIRLRTSCELHGNTRTEICRMLTMSLPNVPSRPLHSSDDYHRDEKTYQT